MRKVLIFFLVLIVLVVVAIGGFVFFTANILVSGAKIVAHEVMGEADQMTASLKVKKYVKVEIKPERLCKDPADDLRSRVRQKDNYLSGWSCFGDSCTINGEVDKAYSDYVFLVKNNHGTCQEIAIPASRVKESDVTYGTIKIGSEYLNQKGIVTDDKKLNDLFPVRETKNGKISSTVSLMGNYRVSVKYSDRPTSDILMISGQPFDVRY